MVCTLTGISFTKKVRHCDLGRSFEVETSADKWTISFGGHSLHLDPAHFKLRAVCNMVNMAMVQQL